MDGGEPTLAERHRVFMLGWRHGALNRRRATLGDKRLDIHYAAGWRAGDTARRAAAAKAAAALGVDLPREDEDG